MLQTGFISFHFIQKINITFVPKSGINDLASLNNSVDEVKKENDPHKLSDFIELMENSIESKNVQN